MTTEHKKHSKTEIAYRSLFIILGAIAMAFGLEGLLIPNDIMDGGVVGVSIMLSHLTNISLGVFIFLINIPFLILGYKQIGKTFALSALLGIAVLAVSTKFLHHIEPFTTDPLIATVAGGIMIGLGIGIVIKSGGVLDGTETLAILINKKTPFSVGQIIMIINLVIFGIGILVFGFDTALYSMLAYFIAFKTIDFVEKGFNDNRSVQVISEHFEEISESLQARLGRGVTIMDAEGGYKGKGVKVVWTIITRLEEAKAIDMVTDIDPNAFIVISEAIEVRGGAFKKRDIH